VTATVGMWYIERENVVDGKGRVSSDTTQDNDSGWASLVVQG
jgi:hypothetical protein